MAAKLEDLIGGVLAEAANIKADQPALCSQTLVTLFKNVLDNPSELKYRTLNITNAKLIDRIFCIKGAEELFVTIGWRKEGNSLVLPMEAALEPMRIVEAYLQCESGCQFVLSDSDLASQIVAGRRQKDDFFARIFGFKEWTSLNFMKTRSAFDYDAASGVLKSRACREREFMAGFFSTPSLEELRARVDLEAARQLSGTGLSVVEVLADVGQLHGMAENKGAVFQAASQFNCLEFPRPTNRPEDGISVYAHDKTQGPACALACPAGTIVRFFFAFACKHAQTLDKQVTNLKDVEAVLGNEDGRFFNVRGGYTLARESGLALLNELLDNPQLREEIMKKLRIGVQTSTEVLATGHGRILYQGVPGQQLVTQTYCSAVSVAYSGCSPTAWEAFARIVLEAAYEATLLVSIENALRNPQLPGSRKVFLTALGGGAFGNDHSWIVSALSKTFSKFKDVGLEVHLVSHKSPMFADLIT